MESREHIRHHATVERRLDGKSETIATIAAATILFKHWMRHKKVIQCEPNGYCFHAWQ
jgi:hypothetical protein